MYLYRNKEEKIRILEILENAFKDSPGVTWMINGNRNKVKNLLKMFVHEASVKNGAYLTKNKNGAVLYFQLQNKDNTISLTFRKLAVLIFVIGIRKGIKTVSTL